MSDQLQKTDGGIDRETAEREKDKGRSRNGLSLGQAEAEPEGIACLVKAREQNIG